MILKSRFAWFALSFLLVFALVVQLRQSPTAADEKIARVEIVSQAAVTVDPHSTADFKLLGAGRCAIGACHGGQAVPDSPTSPYTAKGEYTVWIEHDPHADAYKVLSNSRSKEMVKKLGKSQQATELKMCLACHATMTDRQVEELPDEIPAKAKQRNQAGDPIDFNPDLLRDGVSCESCHGASEKWIAPHKVPSASPRGSLEWESHRSTLKTLGLNDTKDLDTRAAACVKCHVGGPGREVTHDLIAAGHPRLYFEMSAYMAQLPRHWSRAKDVAAYPLLDAAHWQAGQDQAAKAALDLLMSRTKVDRVWPEFSEFDCFSCHHNLQYPTWRQSARDDGSDGLATWGTWQFSILDHLGAKPIDRGVSKPLAELRQLMKEPLPTVNQVRTIADRLQPPLSKIQLSPWFKHQAPANAQLPSINNLIVILCDVPVRNWDEASQVYLALTALQIWKRDPQARDHGQPNDPDQEVYKILSEMRTLLRFPDKTPEQIFDSPADFGSDGATGKTKSLKRFLELQHRLKELEAQIVGGK